MKKTVPATYSPLRTSVIGGVAIPASALVLVACGLLSNPTPGNSHAPLQLLMHPIVLTLTSVATGVAVWLGLFGARCEGLGKGKALLIPAIFLPVLALVAVLWSNYVQTFPQANQSGGSVAFQLLGLLWSLALPPIAITSFLVARASGARAPGV